MATPVHVAINAVFLDPPMGGVEVYVKELCRCLAARPDGPRLTVLANPVGYEALAAEPWAGEVDLVRCGVIGRAGLRALGELSALGAVADRRGADLIHSVAMTGPLASRARRVVTVHDTIWITHPGAGVTHRLWRTVIPRVARRAHRVIADTAAAGGEVERLLGVPGERIDVVPLGFGLRRAGAATPEADLRARLGLGPGPIVLNVGQKGPHRNLVRLVAALARVRAVVPGAQLVLPGPPHAAAEQELREVAAAHGVGDAVTLPGFLDPADLEGLYAAARAFVMPSLVEGFGLPILEAMARGVPVATSASGAVAEVAGDAAVLFDPLDEGAIADATLQLLADGPLRERLVAAGPARAAGYTWERCAEETLVAYARALG